VTVESSWNAGEGVVTGHYSMRTSMEKTRYSALPGVLPREYLPIPVKGKKKGGIAMSIKKVEKKMRGTCKCKVSC
jgi:hypothetical protein